MSYSIVSYTGDGSTTTFAVPFPYIKKADVKVFVYGNEVSISAWPSAGQVTLASAPPPGSAIEIRRSTDRSGPMVVWPSPATVRSGDLNTTVKQLLYLSQESADFTGSSGGIARR